MSAWKTNAAKRKSCRGDELVCNYENTILTVFTVAKKRGKLVQVGSSVVRWQQMYNTDFTGTKRKDSEGTYSVTLRLVGGTTAAVEKQ